MAETLLICTIEVFRKATWRGSRAIVKNSVPKALLLQQTNAFGHEVVLLTDPGPTLTTVVKVFGLFCCKDGRVTALSGLKSGYCNQI